MRSKLPNEARQLIHRLFWKLEVADAYRFKGGRHRQFPVARTYAKLGHIDLSLIMPAIDEDAKNVWYFNLNETTPEVIWPVDRSAAHKITDTSSGWPEGTMQFSRIQTISTAEARALRAEKFSRFMLRQTAAWLRPNNTLYFSETPIAWIGGRWVQSQTRFSHGDEMPKFLDAETKMTGQFDPHFSASMLMSMAFSDRYRRKAIIANKHGFSIMMAMGVETAQEFFKLREVPPEKRRRAALRNWVSSHIRQIDEDRQTVVREHLRNRIEFEWAGFQCEYRPSPFDEEANAQLGAKTG